MITRREFLRLSALLGAGVALPSNLMDSRVLRAMLAPPSPQVPLAAKSIPQFVDPIPNLLDADHLIVDSGTQIALEMRENLTQVLPIGMPKTYTWSYLQPGQANRTSYLGPVIIATRGQPTEIKFVNQLGDTAGTNLLAYKYGTDQTLHWADPLNDGENMLAHMASMPTFGSEAAKNYEGSIPAVPHLHGGFVPPLLDGGPDAWFTSDGNRVGKGFYSKDGNEPKNYCIYRYPNAQEGSLIWFHDHTLGATRLNVLCGLAGGYLITDPANDPKNLPELFPLVIQDRTFDVDGQFFLPADSAGGLLWAPNPEHPYWVPEFVGDTILVNGKTWPYMNVQPKRYTFMIINGSNARTYEMSLTDQVSKNPGPPLWVIATEGGYLDKPVKIDPKAKTNNKLAMMPGERYWVIVDFKGFEAGKVGPNGVKYSGNWLLTNNAKAPYPAGTAPQGSTTGRIMQFRVAGGPVTDTSYNPATGAALRAPMVRLSSTVQKKRLLTLNEVMGMPITTTDPVTGVVATAYPGGPLEILVNNTKWDGMRITGVKDVGMGMYMYEKQAIFTEQDNGDNYISEIPQEGTTELWEIVNLTADAHPIHLHLVQFQLQSRQNFNTANYNKAYAAAFPGGFDFTMRNAAMNGMAAYNGMPVGPGVYIPAYGPPLSYVAGSNLLSGGKDGGNPDVLPYLQGSAQQPLPQEKGWKDTVIAFPGQVTRFLVRWGPTDVPANEPPANVNFVFNPKQNGAGYVWHCHIVDHEDNEMMRPDLVEPNPNVVRTYNIGDDY